MFVGRTTREGREISEWLNTRFVTARGVEKGMPTKKEKKLSMQGKKGEGRVSKRRTMLIKERVAGGSGELGPPMGATDLR